MYGKLNETFPKSGFINHLLIFSAKRPHSTEAHRLKRLIFLLEHLGFDLIHCFVMRKQSNQASLAVYIFGVTIRDGTQMIT